MDRGFKGCTTEVSNLGTIWRSASLLGDVSLGHSFLRNYLLAKSDRMEFHTLEQFPKCGGCLLSLWGTASAIFTAAYGSYCKPMATRFKLLNM